MFTGKSDMFKRLNIPKKGNIRATIINKEKRVYRDAKTLITVSTPLEGKEVNSFSSSTNPYDLYNPFVPSEPYPVRKGRRLGSVKTRTVIASPAASPRSLLPPKPKIKRTKSKVFSPSSSLSHFFLTTNSTSPLNMRRRILSMDGPPPKLKSKSKSKPKKKGKFKVPKTNIFELKRNSYHSYLGPKMRKCPSEKLTKVYPKIRVDKIKETLATTLRDSKTIEHGLTNSSRQATIKDLESEVNKKEEQKLQNVLDNAESHTTGTLGMVRNKLSAQCTPIEKSHANLISFCDFFANLNDVEFYKNSKAIFAKYPLLQAQARIKVSEDESKKVDLFANCRKNEFTIQRLSHQIVSLKNFINNKKC